MLSAVHSLDVTSPDVGPVPSSAVATDAVPASSAPAAASPQPAGVPHGPRSGPAAAASVSAAGTGSGSAAGSSPPAVSRPPLSAPPASSPVVTPPPAGVLSDAPAAVVLVPVPDAALTWSGVFTLTAAGAPARFTIQVPPGFTVAPDGGTVVPGTPVTITVSVVDGASVPFRTVLRVLPAGLPVLIDFPPASPPPSLSSSPAASAPPSAASPVPASGRFLSSWPTSGN